jgi:hypothetical protein
MMALPSNYRPALLPPPDDYGVTWFVHGGYAFEHLIWRTSDNGAGAAATSAAIVAVRLPAGEQQWTDPRPSNRTSLWYAAQAVSIGYEDSAFSCWYCAVPGPLTGMVGNLQDFTREGRRRGDTLWESDNTLQEVVVQKSGGVSRVLAKGHLTGNSSDGASVTFPQNFNSPPLVVMKGGLTFQPASSEWSGTYQSTDPQYDVTEAQDLGVAGFTIYAKLKQFGSGLSTGVNFASGNALSTEGASTTVLASTSGQTDYTFTTNYSVDMDAESTAEGAGFSITVARDTYDGGSWTERGTGYYVLIIESGSSASNTWSAEAKLDTVSSGNLTTGADNWRLRIKSVTEYAAGTYSFTVHGFNQGATDTDADHGVTWPMTSERIASKTPATGDYIAWEAIEVSG